MTFAVLAAEIKSNTGDSRCFYERYEIDMIRLWGEEIHSRADAREIWNDSDLVLMAVSRADALPALVIEPAQLVAFEIEGEIDYTDALIESVGTVKFYAINENLAVDFELYADYVAMGGMLDFCRWQYRMMRYEALVFNSAESRADAAFEDSRSFDDLIALVNVQCELAELEAVLKIWEVQ